MIAADIANNTVIDADSNIEVNYNQVLFRLISKVDKSGGRLANSSSVELTTLSWLYTLFQLFW